MQIFGTSVNGNTISIEIESSDTIETLKEKIENAEYFEEVEKDDNVDKISQLFYNLILKHLDIED